MSTLCYASGYFFCRGIRSMANRSLHLLVRARTGGQMLITESSKICDLYRPQLYSVWTSSPACLFLWDSSRVMGICRLVCSLQKGTIMENANVQNAAAITDKTTLGELLAMLDLADKAGKMPTPRELFETAGSPIADMNGCTLFSNGFAIYQNVTGRTVVWLPYCKSFTYYFGKLRDSEKDTLTETYELPEGFLETQPWVIAVTLIGDHRVEANSMNRTGSRKDTTDYDSADNGDKDGDEERALSDPFRRAFNWYDGHMGENPQDAVERRETREEMLSEMTEKQREAFVMYFRDGMTQEEIASNIGVSRDSVNDRLEGALKKAKKYF